MVLHRQPGARRQGDRDHERLVVHAHRDQVRPATSPGQRQTVWGNGKLQAGWGGSLFTRAAEIIRYSGAGWSNSDIARFEACCTTSTCRSSITGWSNGANWLMTFAETTIDIAVFTNDRAAFDAGVATWRRRPRPPSTRQRRLAPDLTRRLPRHRQRDQDLLAQPHPVHHRTPRRDPPRPHPHDDGPGRDGQRSRNRRDPRHRPLRRGAPRIIAGFERNAGYVNAYLDEVARLGGARTAPDLGAHRLGRPEVQGRGTGLRGAGRWRTATTPPKSASRCPTPSVWCCVRARPVGRAPPVVGDAHPRSLRLTAGGRRPPGRARPWLGTRKRTSLASSSSRVGDDDHDVEPDRPVLDVEEVESFVGVHRTPEVRASTCHRPGDARHGPWSGSATARRSNGPRSAGRGRGPTRLMSPRSTFQTCGSSSTLRARSTRPDPGDARVVLHLEQGPVALVVGEQLVEVLLGAHGHQCAA